MLNSDTPLLATVANMKAARAAMGSTAYRKVFMWSPGTGEQSSAHPGDYWVHDPDKVFVDSDGDPMVLAYERREMVMLEEGLIADVPAPGS